MRLTSSGLILQGKSFVGHPHACQELRLLGVKVALAIASPLGAVPEAQLVQLCTDCIRLDRYQRAVGIVQQDGAGIEQPAASLGRQEAGDLGRGPEQHQGLVDEVDAQVIGDARARRAQEGSFARVVDGVPVKVRLELQRPTQGVRLDDGLKRLEVGVPPPVLIHGQHERAVPGEADQVGALCRRWREGLLDNH